MSNVFVHFVVHKSYICVHFNPLLMELSLSLSHRWLSSEALSLLELQYSCNTRWENSWRVFLHPWEWQVRKNCPFYQGEQLSPRNCTFNSNSWRGCVGTFTPGGNPGLFSKKIYIIGLTPRLNYFNRTAVVNKILVVDSKKKSWLFRGSAKHIYEQKHLKCDQFHLNSQALSSVKSILKKKLLYGNYISEVDKAGHLTIFNCTWNCTCDCWALNSWVFALLISKGSCSRSINFKFEIPKVLF